MARIPLFNGATGVSHYIHVDDLTGEGTMVESTMSEDTVAAILDNNGAMANHNDGYSQSRDICRIASIPMAMVYHLREHEGWDPLSPFYSDKLTKLLNDSDYRKLRTGGGRV